MGGVRRRTGAWSIVAGVALIAVGTIGALASDDPQGPEGATAGVGSTGSTAPTASSATGATEPTGSTAQIETPEAFLSSFAEAIRQGDARFLFDRLHPVVVDLYGAQACRAAVRAFVDPTTDLVFVSTSEPGPYLFEADGTSTEVQDVLTVEVEGQGQPIHLGIVGSELRWFTDCGDPA